MEEGVIHSHPLMEQLSSGFPVNICLSFVFFQKSLDHREQSCLFLRRLAV